MSKYTYNRDIVPVGGQIDLEVQFADSAGNPKDSTPPPSLSIFDAGLNPVQTVQSSALRRMATGYYRLRYTIPDGYIAGVWTDSWFGTVDGYEINAIFDINVNSVGSVQAVGTVVDPVIEVGDDPWPSLLDHTQEAKANINFLLRMLKSRLRSIAFKPDGSKCDIFSNEDLYYFLIISLSEFNLTPTITGYIFDDPLVRTLFADIITQGAMLQAWSGQAILEAGKEYSINDNGATISPPPVSSTITQMFNTQLSDYRSKLRELKHNLRPSPLGMSAGSFFARNPQVTRLRHLREKQIL